MRFIHLSDLHLGIRLKNYDLSKDQKYVLRQIVEKTKELNVDAVIIAGDIYDKAQPSADAVSLFNDFITELSKVTKNILIIGGNHDSGLRLNCYRDLLKNQNIYIIGTPPGKEDDKIEKITLKDAYGEVDFYLLPFVKPSLIKNITGEPGLSYEQAVHRLIEREQIDYSRRNVLVSHQYYINVEKDITNTTTITVGNIDAISYQIVEKFDYVALGHIHTPMNTGANHIRYCGTPMPYSINETKNGMLAIEMKEKGILNIEKIPLEPLHKIRKITGLLDDILKESSDDYVSITLTDLSDFDVIDMQVRIREQYKNVLEIKRFQSEINYEELEEIKMEEITPMDMFSKFVSEITEQEKNILEKIINKVTV